MIIFLPQQDIEMNLKYYLHLNFHEEKKSVFKNSDITFLSNSTSLSLPSIYRTSKSQKYNQLAICTNYISSLIQLRSSWGILQSKYDGLMHANLNREYPSERHIYLLVVDVGFYIMVSQLN